MSMKYEEEVIKMRKELTKYSEEKVTILLIGSKGVGKSALVNSFVMAFTGIKCEPAQSVSKSGTHGSTETKPYLLDNSGTPKMNLRLIDTIGLELTLHDIEFSKKMIELLIQGKQQSENIGDQEKRPVFQENEVDFVIFVYELGTDNKKEAISQFHQCVSHLNVPSILLLPRMDILFSLEDENIEYYQDFDNVPDKIKIQDNEKYLKIQKYQQHLKDVEEVTGFNSIDTFPVAKLDSDDNINNPYMEHTYLKILNQVIKTAINFRKPKENDQVESFGGGKIKI